MNLLCLKLLLDSLVVFSNRNLMAKFNRQSDDRGIQELERRQKKKEKF